MQGHYRSAVALADARGTSRRRGAGSRRHLKWFVGLYVAPATMSLQLVGRSAKSLLCFGESCRIAFEIAEIRAGSEASGNDVRLMGMLTVACGSVIFVRRAVCRYLSRRVRVLIVRKSEYARIGLEEWYIRGACDVWKVRYR